MENIQASYDGVRMEFARRVRDGAGSPSAHREALAWFQNEVQALQGRCQHPFTIGSCCGSDRICTDCHARIPS